MMKGMIIRTCHSCPFSENPKGPKIFCKIVGKRIGKKPDRIVRTCPLPRYKKDFVVYIPNNCHKCFFLRKIKVKRNGAIYEVFYCSLDLAGRGIKDLSIVQEWCPFDNVLEGFVTNG